MINRKILLLILSSYLFSVDITPMIGSPSVSVFNSKNDEGAFILAFNTIYEFKDFDSSFQTSSKHANVSANLLLSSGIEFKVGKFIKMENVDFEYKGISYHVRKRKYGIGLHFTSYDHNFKNIYTSKFRETGISLHLRFRKKTIKPFLYYSTTSLYNTSAYLYPDKPVELISFGATNILNNIVFSTYLTAQLEDVLNLDLETAQINVTVGALLN